MLKTKKFSAKKTRNIYSSIQNKANKKSSPLKKGKEERKKSTMSINRLIRCINSEIWSIKSEPYCIGLHEFEIVDVMSRVCIVAVSGNVEINPAYKAVRDLLNQELSFPNNFLMLNSIGKSARNYGLCSPKYLTDGYYLCVEPKLAAECDKLRQEYGDKFRSLGEYYFRVFPSTGQWTPIPSCQECTERKKRGQFDHGRARSSSPCRW